MNSKKELSFYRSIFQNMNAAVYVLNHDPYKIEWITDNKTVLEVTGITAKQILEIGEFIPIKFLQKNDYEESVTNATEGFYSNPDMKWAGVYQLNDVNGNLKWILYSVKTLIKNEDGTPQKYVVVAIPLDDLFNTPKSLNEFSNHLLSKINHAKRSELTKRQSEVLSLLKQGKKRKDISVKLGISVYTVDDHIAGIKKKFNIESNAELISFAERIQIE